MIPRGLECTFNSKFAKDTQRGSITVLFVFFALLLVGAISYALYTGQQVEKKIALQNASDTSSLAIANHAGQGLNMISANNLALGGAIHVAGAVPILAAYISMGWVFTATGVTALEEFGVGVADVVFQGKIVEPRNVFQDKIYNNLAPVSGFYMQLASGLTKYNDFMNKWWLLPAGISGMEMHRVNLPGSLSLPFQKIRAPVPVYMSYEGIGKSSPKSTICHSIKASALGAKNAGESGDARSLMLERDDFLTWLNGPLASIPAAKGAAEFIDEIGKLKKALADVMPVDLGFVDCGFGLKTSLFAITDVTAKHVEKSNPVAQRLVVAATGINLTRIVSEVVGPAIPKRPGWTGVRSVARRAWENVVEPGLHGVSETVIQAELARFSGDSVRWKTIEKMYKNSKDYSCENGDTVVAEAVPIIESGEVVCIPISTIDSKCAVEHFISQFRPVFAAPLVLGKMVRLIDNFDRDHCVNYKRYAIDMSPNKDVEKKKEYSARGVPIANWGKQAKAYGENDSEVTADRKGTLAFLFPKDEQAFADGNTFYTLSANALRTSAEYSPANCPNGYMVEDSGGKKRCEVLPLIALAGDSDNASVSGDAKVRFDRDYNAMTSGMNKLVKAGQVASDSTAGALSNVWSRVQWTTSGSKILYQGTEPVPGSFRNQLFWPAWKSQLSNVDAGTLKSLLQTVSPANDASPGAVSTLKAE